MLLTLMQTSRTGSRIAFLAAGMATLTLAANASGQAAPQITRAVDESRLVTLSGNTHPLARAQYDLGQVAASGRMLLVFKRHPEQEATLQQLLRDQQNPASPQYHKWLSPDAFGERFGIADLDLQTVTGYLQDKGFAVGKLSRGRMSLEISGTADQIREAFHTEIHRYSVGGNEFFANDRDPQIPQALAPVVAGFAALNNYRKPQPSGVKQATLDPVTHALKPEFTTVSGTTTSYGVSPGDIARIYNIPAEAVPTSTVPWIGVISDSNVNLTNVTAYSTLFALGANLPSVIVDGEDPGVTTDALTTTEELELIAAVAPHASVNLYTAATSDYDTGLDFATVRAVGDDVVNIIDFGFLNCESALGTAGNQFVSTTWEQAAAQGITVISATGDAGAAGCDLPGGEEGQETSSYGPAVNGWASTPYNTAVGGTDFYYTAGAPATNYWNATNSGTPAFVSAKGIVPQQPWDDSDEATDQVTSTSTPLFGGGGGASSLGYNGVSGYPVPGWQSTELGALATTRAVPDLSLFAGDGLNSSRYILCFAAGDCASGTSSTFTTAGGTAAAASVFAGIVAQIIQKDAAQGNINPGLYSLAATSTSNSFTTTTTAFFDVTSGSNYVACAFNCTNGVSLTIHGVTGTYIGYAAAAGYDLASGLGTVNASNLISKWSNINSGTTPGTVTLGVYSSLPSGALTSGATITHGAVTYMGATVTAAGGKPTPTGDVAVLSSDIQAADTSIDRVTLVGGTGSDSGGIQLPGGTYTLTAHYAGDTNYAPANSSAFTITVNPEPSQVLIMSASDQATSATNYVQNLNFSLLSASTVPYGTQVRITVEPFGLNTNTSFGIPSGSITVLDNGSAIASIPINGEGAATFASSSLAVGNHSFTFSYAGDASFQASTSLAATGGSAIYNYQTSAIQTAIAFTVTSVATQTALSATSTDLTASGGSSTLTAVVSSAGSMNTGSAPTGQVAFKFVNSGGGVTTSYVTVTPAYDSNGDLVATASETVTAVGTYTASFVPTGNYQASTGNSISISNSFCDIFCFTTNSTTTLTTVGGGTTYSSSSDLVFNIQVKATYYFGAIIPLPITTTNVTGTVNIYANGVQVGQAVTLNSATGSATFTVPKTGNYLDVPSGTVVFTAYYSGGIGLPGNILQFTADPSVGSDTLTIQGNSQGNPTTPKLSGDFSLQTLQTAQVMPAGTTGSLAFPLQLTATNSFAQNYSGSNIALSCSSTTPGLTCALNSNSISLNSGFGTATATITVSSNYTVALIGPEAKPFGWWKSGGEVAMACLLLLGIPARRRSWRGMVSMLVLCGVAIGMSGCGGNGLNSEAAESASASSSARPAGPPTRILPGSGSVTNGSGNKTQGPGFKPELLLTLPAGTYPVTVTGTVTLNSVVVTHNAVFNVVVQ